MVQGWGTGMTIAAIGLAVCLLAVLHYTFWMRRLRAPLPYDLLETLTLPDGVRCQLRRLGPAARTSTPPALLVHGIAINHRNLDISAQTSLARTLRDKGHDVWLLTLRSGLPDSRAFERRRTTFSAMVEHDLPVAVAEVCRRTGAAQVDYIGFSMGGMLLYAALGRSVPLAAIRKVAIIGSPGRVRIPIPLLSKLRGLPMWIAPPFPFRVPGRMVAFASEWLHTPIHRIPYNPANVAPGITRTALVNAICDVPAALNRELGRWAMGDGQIRVGGQRALDALAQVRTPVRFFAGVGDRLAPPNSVQAACDAWGSDHGGVDKALSVVGLAHGHAADYGHGDLALGAHAEADVFLPIADFLAASSRAP